MLMRQAQQSVPARLPWVRARRLEPSARGEAVQQTEMVSRSRASLQSREA
jgi:hypothetical protein